MKNVLLSAVTALGLALPASAADDSLAARAASHVGVLIAQQGSAALTQIREELKKNLIEQLNPYLPAPDQAATLKRSATPARAS